MPESNVLPFTPGPVGELQRHIEKLSEDLRAGRLMGLAYIASYIDDQHASELAGELRARPRFARGLLLDLDEKFAELTRS